MKCKKLTALLLTAAMTASVLAGCGGDSAGDAGTSNTDGGSNEEAASGEDGNKDIIDFSMFIAMPGPEINDGNEIQEIIAQKTGVRVKETWLTGQTAAEAVGTIIAGGEYPDFIDGGDGQMALYDAGALVAWDDYLEKHPKLKEMYSDEEWDRFRQEDGKIYWANIFQNTYGESKATTHNDEAFWIQARVLAWDNYPEIKTLDQYFDLLERYAAANPTMEDGSEVIPYTILCEDWRYFCIENAGQFLAGYPNDGSVIVNTETMKIEDYNTSETTHRYFQKLNEEYHKGIVDHEFATQTYDEYIAKLSTGRVLGMCDQWWDFYGTVNDVFKQQGLDLEGCNYVPLGLTIDEGMENMWHTYGDTQNLANGVAVTTSCKDVDYQVDEDGLYYRTEEQRMQWANKEYQASHRCVYSYMPQYRGTSRDGKNAMNPEEQTSEFFSSLAQPLVDCFNAYGVTTYVEMIGSVEKETGPWFPMYSFSNNMTTETPGGVAWTKMGEVKHEWLPKVVMSDSFDSTWSDYMTAYEGCAPEDFLAEMQTELDRRASLAQ